ncbi:myosin heavy chain, embryonic smooth muscle isoform isoform X2 [Drosophila subpulchrella]|uniref:myosin heavy chain, embryonic smooth muscle isoform isoform X2 n=1 Tax=Drosophila subpulchrella TaxID=1486046 RepID=UPI0018A15B1A|nr:myosin heavy chain, embryonic smooth muscle isoform isoform X2 [Drosophila subpulchrella]
MVSPRKPASSYGPRAPRLEANNLMAASAKSCESLFSASSRESASLIYQRSKPAQQRGGMKGSSGTSHPTMSSQNHSEIHQRVMSARNLRAKTFQNQLADAQAEIANLAHENRMLRTLHKRQSSALNKYESNNAELPQLLHSHAEELRVWQTKYRNLQAANKDLELKLKQKEAIILSLSDQNKHYSQLNKDKNLDERQKLQEKLKSLEQRLEDKDNDMKLMARKVQLESKNFRQQLLNEQKKGKEVMLKLEKARLEISGYRKLEEYTLGTEKVNPLSSGRRTKLSGVTEEPDKIDKLEKSLDMLDKAIEKNNQSEFNALTDVMESESFYDFEKDSAEDKSGPSTPPGQPERQTAGGRGGKLVLPPATNHTKMGQNASRSTLSQVLSAQGRIPVSSAKAARSRIGVAAPKAGSVQASKRREPEVLSRMTSAEVKSKQQSLKSLEYEYEDDYEQAGEDDEDDAYAMMGKMCEEGEEPEDNSEENANEASLVKYAAYLDAKSSEGDPLEESLEDDDEGTDGQQTQRSDDESQDNSVRAPRLKENMSSLRKQISDDYKERESFLKTFCRQASNSNMRDDPAPKKRNSIAGGAAASSHMTGSRKHALLAALKTIDDNKSQD